MKSEKLNRDKGLSFRSVFAIRREEWPVAAIVTVLLLVIHYFFISRFFDQFMDYSVGARNALSPAATSTSIMSRPYSLRCSNALADGLRHSASSAPCMDDVAALYNKPRAMATHRLQLRAVYRWLSTILLRFL